MVLDPTELEVDSKPEIEILDSGLLSTSYTTKQNFNESQSTYFHRYFKDHEESDLVPNPFAGIYE